MNNIKHISSAQNAFIKKVALLKEKSRERKKTGLFVLEGLREFTLALKGRYDVETVLFCEDFVSLTEISAILKDSKNTPEVISISKAIYQKIAYRQTTEGVLAICKAKTHALSDLIFSTNTPLILVAEAPEKPGNLGALLRTADAANLDAVLIANLTGDIYNPNSVRSSVGCVFTNQIATGSTQDIIDFLKQKNIAIHCAALTASIPYTLADFKKPSAIVVGTEATGLTENWLQNSDENIIIPMEGEIDSMNVSVSAAILIFEAKRQRTL